MPEVGSTWVTVLPDMRRFNSDLSRQATTSGDTAGKTFGSGFAKAAAVGLAVFGAARVFGGFIADARESAQVSRLTENAIRATGSAANVTASQVSDLATTLSNKSAIDDELIQSGANLILTFKNIANVAGEGNNIFDRTTEAALDLSSAGFGSIESASVMLGKALNDPLAGLTALSRAGVTFTEQQKEQIRVLTEAGDLLGAQRIILDEVASQVGGAAAAAADPMARLGVVAGNVGEAFGTAMLPFLEKAATFIVDDLIPAIQWAWANVIVPAFEWLRDNIPPIWEQYVKPPLMEFWGFIQDFLIPVITWLWQNVVVPAFTAIWEIVQAAWVVIGPILSLLWDFISNVLGPVFLWLLNEVITPVWNTIGAVISGAWGFIAPVFNFIGDAIENLAAGFGALGDVAAGVWYDIQRTFVIGVNFVVDVVNRFLDALITAAQIVLPSVVAASLENVGRLGHMGYPTAPSYSNVAMRDIPRAGGYALGGLVPGKGDGDTVPAWLTPEEIVIRKEIAVPFREFLLALNDGQAEAKRAAGGPGARGPQRFAAGGTVASAQEWARQNSGRPYIWGGVGPYGWDCSGWMSDIANHLLGTAMHQRRFATASMSGGVNAGGFVRGLNSAFTIGVNPGSHTAGTLGGINVESGSGHGGIIGGNALGTSNSSFPYKYYLPGVAMLADQVAALVRSSLMPASGGGVAGMIEGFANVMMGGTSSWAKEMDAAVFDRGGILNSGGMAINRSGHPELILDPEQTRAALAGGIPSIRIFIGTTEITDIIRVEIDSDKAQTKLDKRALQRSSA